MKKWGYLVEADSAFRDAERAYNSSKSPENAQAYVAALVRSNNIPSNADTRFKRLIDDYKKDPTEHRAKWLLTDLERLNGPRDRQISETCRLMGKMGNVCNQANQTEITTKYFVILRSYQTPVAYRVRGTNEPSYRTSERHSSTTTNHVTKWINLPVQDVTQRELDEIYRAI